MNKILSSASAALAVVIVFVSLTWGGWHFGIVSAVKEKQRELESVVNALPQNTTVSSVSSASATVVIGSVMAGSSIYSLLGVNIGPGPQGDVGNADVTTGYQLIGVNSIRTHDYYGPLDMATMYPNQSSSPADASSYNFTNSDTTFQKILDGGFEPYLRLGDSYNNSSGYPEASPRAPSNPNNWILAAVEVVRHYNDSTRWGRSPLRYVEIWNEPDNSIFWDSSDTDFFVLFSSAAKALKSSFPSLKIGGPGLTPAGSMSPSGRQYTRRFLDYQMAQTTPIDFFSWHIYSNDPVDFSSAAAFYRVELDSRGFTTTESHISEWNTSTSSKTQSESEALRFGGQGASIMTAAWIALERQGVRASNIYRGTDPSPSAPTFYGIFYADGRLKRTAWAFSLWKQMSAHSTPLSVSTTTANSTLYVLAGKDASEEIAVLMANPTASTQTWVIELPNDGISRLPYYLQQVSDASESVSSSTISGLSGTIGSYAVQLLTVRP